MPRRRWLQFSLRGFLIMLTAFAVWLGVVAHRAREQREAVEAIRALGGYVLYEGEDRFGEEAEQAGPAWLRKIIGDDYFYNVAGVGFGYFWRPGYYWHSTSVPDSDILKVLPHLKRLRTLERVSLPSETSNGTLDKLKAALPDCEVYRIVS